MRVAKLAALGAALAVLMAADGAFAADAARPIISPTTAWEETWGEVLTDLFIIGGLFGLAGVYLLFAYRAKGPDAVGTAKPLNLNLALAWALIPAAVFMADDFLLSAKGWSLWNVQRTVPANAMEVQVSATQWSFEFAYPDGFKSDELVVPVGQPVVLRMTAQDVIHSFGLTAYRLKEDILPGRITHLWFYPDKPLETFVTCVEFCGDGHANMNATVRAVSKDDYDAWVAKKMKKKASLEATPATSKS